VLLTGLLGGIFPISTSRADTVYLKSGISISVTKAQEKDGQIEYWVGSTRYTISKDRVLKIEKGDTPVTPTRGVFTGVQDLTRRDSMPSASQHDKVTLPHLSGPKQNEAYWMELRNRITAGETIDNQHLAEIEIQHDNRRTADAFYLAGTMEMQRGHPDQASGYFEHAIQAMPDRVDLLQWDAAALARSERYAEAALPSNAPTHSNPTPRRCCACSVSRATTPIAPPMPLPHGSGPRSSHPIPELPACCTKPSASCRSRRS
jgi:hypothetical protein